MATLRAAAYSLVSPIATPPRGAATGSTALLRVDVDSWVADAIEPVMSPPPDSCRMDTSSVLSSDGDSSPRSRLGRFRAIRHIRVSLRRKPRLLALPPQYRRSSARRSSVVIAMNASRHRPDWRLSTEPSLASTRPWSVSSHGVLSLSDLERPSDECEDRPEASRRSRAWKRITDVGRRIKRSKATTVMYSITFYPWKMDANCYYSNPEAAAEWVPDTASTRCQICVAAFTIARRRHHCRLCGILVCNDCSMQRTFLPFSEDTQRRSNHSLIKSGEAQRTCNGCATTLKNMAAQQDPRVKQFAVQVPQDGNRTSVASGRSSCPTKISSARDSTATVSPELQLQVARPRAWSKTTRARHEELDEVVMARAKSRTTSASAKTQHVISSEWLEQWLQFVQAESSEAVHMAARPSMSRASMGSRHRMSRLPTGRRPGPIANYSLLNFVNGKLVPCDDLKRSRGTDGTMGDYHVISHDVWLVFLRLYGGGPCITIDDSDSLVAQKSSLSLIPTAADDIASPRPLSWIITELNDAVSASQFAATKSKLAATKVKPQPQEALAVTKKMTSTRPASATAIHASLPPLPLARSISESQRSSCDRNTQASRRVSSTFVGYWKKWRHGDELSDQATITPVDDGVVLYDPQTSVPTDEDKSDSDEERVGVTGFEPERQRETIAAVSAFAAAAAAARKKSTRSLLRHSTALTPRSASDSTITTA